MYRRRIRIDKLDGFLRFPISKVRPGSEEPCSVFTHRDTVQTPFDRLGRKALSLDVPPQRDNALRGNIDVRFGLANKGFSNLSTMHFEAGRAH